jgi:thiamine biosynthesis protein ThiC
MAKGIFHFWDGKQFRTFASRQRKMDPTVKVIYKWTGTTWEKYFEGAFDAMQTELKHQKKLAHQAEMRTEVADLCGTSYAAAKRDMGL